MSRLTNMVKQTNFCCLSQKLLTTLKCSAKQVPLTIFDPNKVRGFHERLNQWDFYNRELEMQRLAEEAKQKANLKAHSKFSMNPLPDYSHQLVKKKDEENAKKQANYAKLGGSDADKGRGQRENKAIKSEINAKRRETSKSAKGESDNNKRDYDSSKHCSSRGSKDGKKRAQDYRNTNRRPNSEWDKSSGSQGRGSLQSSSSSQRSNFSGSGNGSREHMIDSKKRKNTSKKRNDSAKRSHIDLDNKLTNLLGKTLDYLTTDEYKRISPELLKLLQEKQLLAKRNSLKRATWQDDVLKTLESISKDSLDEKNPALAQYLRNQMEGDSIMNKLYNIDFYNKNSNDDLLNAFSSSQSPYNKMNLYGIKEVLKILQSGGKLTQNQLELLYDFLKSAAEMDPESFDHVMAFSVNLGLLDAKMVDYLKSLMMRTGSNLTLEKIGDLLELLHEEAKPAIRFNYQLLLPRFARKVKILSPQTNDYIRRYPSDRNIEEESSKKRKKGYIYPEKIKKELPEVPEPIVEEVEIPKLGERPHVKNNYVDFRLKHTTKLKESHPPGYYEPISVEDLVLKGFSKLTFSNTGISSATMPSVEKLRESPISIENILPRNPSLDTTLSNFSSFRSKRRKQVKVQQLI